MFVFYYPISIRIGGSLLVNLDHSMGSFNNNPSIGGGGRLERKVRENSDDGWRYEQSE